MLAKIRVQSCGKDCLCLRKEREVGRANREECVLKFGLKMGMMFKK